VADVIYIYNIRYNDSSKTGFTVEYRAVCKVYLKCSTNIRCFGRRMVAVAQKDEARADLAINNK